MNNKNYIAEFMKDNDLNIGEEFEIELKGDLMHFTKDYRLFSKNDKSRAYELGFLLTGNAQVKKIPKLEYVEVDNNVPRFTEIEVRDEDNQEWKNAYFIFMNENEDILYPYYTTDCNKNNLRYFSQARMLKPSESEFKQGELIEVRGIDDDTWVKREYLGKLNEFYICRSRGDVIGWEYARKIERK